MKLLEYLQCLRGIDRGMEKPRLYSLFSRIVYEHARLLIVEASFASAGSSSFVRKLYTGVIQQWSSPIANTCRACAFLLMLGRGKISWITDLFPPFFLVLASLDNMLAHELCSRGMCSTSAFENFFIFSLTRV